MKINSWRFGSKTLGILAVLLLATCGKDEVTNDPDVLVCEGENVYGPQGGVIEITDTNSQFYGLRIVIPAGALNECRSLYVDEGFVSFLPAGCSGYSRSDAQFDLSTGGDKPYDLELEFQFPVANMTVGPDEYPCAFGYDNRTGKWNVIMPDEFDGSTMTVRTTYLDMWMWGKINRETIATEYLIGAVQEKFGDEAWNSALSGIAEAINVMHTLYVDQTCATWTRMRDVDLPGLIDEQVLVLESFQSQVAQCGACDLFSDEFGSELSSYLLAKVTILTSNLWDLYTGGGAGYLPWLGEVDFIMWVNRIVAYTFIESQACNFDCITHEVGLGVCEAYVMHRVYIVTRLMVALAISGDFWITGP